MSEIFANYINGEWVKRDKTIENRNPANTDELVGLFAKGTAQDVDDAANAIVPALIHRERRRPRRVQPPHMFFQLGVDARAARRRLVRLLVAERPRDDAGVVAVAAHPAYGWQPVAEAVKSSMGTSAFESAWARGARMDRDSAVAIVEAELDAVEAELAKNA